jgi:hypothetical protein
MTQPRAVRPEELRQQFLDYLLDAAGNRADPKTAPGLSWPERMQGLVHDVLAALDGLSTELPAFDLVARSHPKYRALRQARGENWVEDGTVINRGVELSEIWRERTGTRENGGR